MINPVTAFPTQWITDYWYCLAQFPTLNSWSNDLNAINLQQRASLSLPQRVRCWRITGCRGNLYSLPVEVLHLSSMVTFNLLSSIFHPAIDGTLYNVLSLNIGACPIVLWDMLCTVDFKPASSWPCSSPSRFRLSLLQGIQKCVSDRLRDSTVAYWWYSWISYGIFWSMTENYISKALLIFMENLMLPPL